MGRSHHHPSSCKVCGRHRTEVGSISQTGLCSDHSEERLLTNIDEMRTRSGDGWREWRRGMARCAGLILVDSRAEEA